MFFSVFSLKFAGKHKLQPLIVNERNNVARNVNEYIPILVLQRLENIEIGILIIFQNVLRYHKVITLWPFWIAARIMISLKRNPQSGDDAVVRDADIVAV